MQRWQEAHPDDSGYRDDDQNQHVNYRLTPDERRTLSAGLIEWGGPAHCTEELALAMGFASVADLHNTGYRLADDISEGRPLRALDWTRALLATEIVFISDVVGSGLDWPITTGLDDQLTIRVIRSLQRHLVTVRR